MFGDRERRTRSMLCMLVTLDVSKLSSWLKAFAFCRVEKEECVPRRQHVWAAGGLANGKDS